MLAIALLLVDAEMHVFVCVVWRSSELQPATCLRGATISAHVARYEFDCAWISPLSEVDDRSLAQLSCA